MQSVSSKKVVNVQLNENNSVVEKEKVVRRDNDNHNYNQTHNQTHKQVVVRLEQEVTLLKKRMNNPKVDLVEKDNIYYVRMETTGDIENINIELNESQVLIVSFSKPYPEKDESEKVIYRECRYGKFIRRVKLPSKVTMISKDNLEYNNGVLNLEFIKKDEE
jgi:HSP20 family molecular chaperone IbpA